MTNVNQTYCGGHLTIYTNVELLCCTPETDRIVYVNYALLKEREIQIRLLL